MKLIDHIAERTGLGRETVRKVFRELHFWALDEVALRRFQAPLPSETHSKVAELFLKESEVV